MSLAMRAARAGNCGDPGLFGFLGGIAKAGLGVVTGGVSNVIFDAAKSVLGGGRSTGVPISVAKASASTPLLRPVGTSLPILRSAGAGMINTTRAILQNQQPVISGVNVGGAGGLTIGTIKPGIGATQMAPTGWSDVQAGSSSTAKVVCNIPGHHMNKQTYFTRNGAVPAGTKCVKNRRRNPLNPRALSRAMSRVASAQKAVRCLGLFAGTVARASKAKSQKRRGCGGRCKR